MLPKSPRFAKESLVMQQECGFGTSAGIEFLTENVCHANNENKHQGRKNYMTSHKKILKPRTMTKMC